MTQPAIYSNFKVGVYVDVVNMTMNGGFYLQYDVLREFVCRDGAHPVRLNAYVAYDPERAKQDPSYRSRANGFHSILRDYGYKIIVKEVRWFQNEDGRYAKANADLDLAVDALLQTEKLDRVLIATGDGDFVRVVHALQSRGCRVEIVGLDNVSHELRAEADLYISGYLIPGLIPIENEDEEETNPWGEIGSRVRGWCYWHNQTYGFFRYLKTAGPNLWVTDPRSPLSPFDSAFFHDSNLPPGARKLPLPSRNSIFEFTLFQSERGPQAVDIGLVGQS